MKEPSIRQKRVASEVQVCVSQMLREDFSHHPVLGGRPMTVMDVVVSPDLRHVRVYVMPLGGGERQSLLEALGTLTPAIRKLLGRQLALRMVPHIVFKDAADMPLASLVRL